MNVFELFALWKRTNIRWINTEHFWCMKKNYLKEKETVIFRWQILQFGSGTFCFCSLNSAQKQPPSSENTNRTFFCFGTRKYLNNFCFPKTIETSKTFFKILQFAQSADFSLDSAAKVETSYDFERNYLQTLACFATWIKVMYTFLNQSFWKKRHHAKETL